jgi:hypothetical protein
VNNSNEGKEIYMQKNIKKIIAMILFLLALAALPLITCAEEQKPPEAKTEQKAVEQQKTPEEDKVTGEVDLSVLSAYIWRGYEQTRNSVVIEPAATLSYKGFSVNVWGNLDTKPYSPVDNNYSSKYTETDYTLSYSKKFGILQVTPGYIYYALGAPNAGAVAPQDSQEVFLSLGLDTILSPTLAVYKEIDHYHQWYFLLGLSHTFELSKKVGLKLAASASYLLSTDETTYAKYDSDSNATNDKFNNFHDGTFTVCLPIALTKSLTVTPTASYVFPLSDDARYEMKAFGKKGTAASDRDSSYLYGGLTLSFTF